MQLSILDPMAWLLKDTARAVGEAEEAEIINKISLYFEILEYWQARV